MLMIVNIKKHIIDKNALFLFTIHPNSKSFNLNNKIYKKIINEITK